MEAPSFDIDIEKPKRTISSKYNLTSEERQALNELKIRDDIVISNANADKGGAVVIQGVYDYRSRTTS